jgi:hypothetical protein
VVGELSAFPQLELLHLTSEPLLLFSCREFLVGVLGAFPQLQLSHLFTEPQLFFPRPPLTMVDPMSHRLLGLDDEVRRFLSYLRLGGLLGLVEPGVGQHTDGLGLGAGRCSHPICVLSLLAAPDSIVRSINEAVNYQFGFDITSSWGYQLVLRNFIRLFAIGATVVLALTTLVVVQPQEQAVRLRFGDRVGSVYQGGPMAKLPWPVDTALVLDVNLVRELPLGNGLLRNRGYYRGSRNYSGSRNYRNDYLSLGGGLLALRGRGSLGSRGDNGSSSRGGLSLLGHLV